MGYLTRWGPVPAWAGRHGWRWVVAGSRCPCARVGRTPGPVSCRTTCALPLCPRGPDRLAAVPARAGGLLPLCPRGPDGKFINNTTLQSVAPVPAWAGRTADDGNATTPYVAPVPAWAGR